MERQTIKIRNAKISEVKQIASLQRKLNLYHKKIDPEYYALNKNAKKIFIKFAKKNIRSKNGMLLVAVDRNIIVGYVLGVIKKYPPVRKIKRFGYIFDLFVEKSYRKKGIATKFTVELIKWFKKKKLKYIELGVDSRNKLGFEAWKKLGFKEHTKGMIKRKF